MASPAGFHVASQYGALVNVDNFRIGSLPAVQFQAPSAAGPRSASPAGLVVALSNIYSQPVTVTFTRTGGTAVENTDFRMPATSVDGLVALKRSPVLTSTTRLDNRFAVALASGTLTVISGPDAAADTDFYFNLGWAASNNYQNYGGRTTFSAGQPWFLSKFKVQALPGFAGAQVEKAQLRFYYTAGNTGLHKTAYVISSDWIEGTATGQYPGVAGGASAAHPMGHNTNQNQNANGGTAAPLQSWANNDYFALAKDVSPTYVTASAHNAGADFVVYDVTSFVQLWANGTPNYGFCTYDNSNNFTVQTSETTQGATCQPVLCIDYSGQMASTTLNFNPGETSKTIPLTILADSPNGPGRTITVSLSSPTNATLGADPACTYTITGTDAISPSAPQLGTVTGTTVLLLDPGSENDATTAYLVQETTTGQYVGPGGRLQSSPFWQPRQAWANTVVWGLSGTTAYQFRSKARNDLGVESIYGPATNATTTFAGDVNGDGTVDVIDLLSLADAWDRDLGEPGFDPACDLNADNTVNVIDLLILAEHWGS